MNKFIVDLVNFLKKMLDLRLGFRLDLRLEVKKMLDSSGPDSNNPNPKSEGTRGSRKGGLLG